MTERPWGERLGEAIEELGFTKTAVAKKVGITYRSMARWGSDDNLPKPENRRRLGAIDPTLAALVSELPERRPAAAAGGLSRADLTEGLEELSATVDGLKRTVASLRRRIRALELQLPDEAAGSAQEGS